MSEPLSSKNGSLFIQLSPDDKPEYLACVDLADIPAPVGAQTLFYCRNRDGVVRAIGATQGVPEQGTTTITVPVFPDADLLDRIGNCDVTIYVMADPCGKLGIFNSYTRGVVLYNARITNRTLQNLVMREADEKTMRVYEIAYRGVYNLRALSVTRQTIAETRDLNTIVFDMETRCAGSDCGAPKDPNDVGYIGTDGTAGSPTSDADIWATDDGGTTWANTTGATASPFTGGDIVSAVMFQMDKNTWRLLVASGQKSGYAQVAYSDDDGSTWTTVNVGSTAWEGFAHAGALFAFDSEHIWAATTHGRVYFSEDGGVTWTSQTSALTASGARALYGVHFSDYDNGFAAGADGTLIYTNDGGETWTALTTAPTSSNTITALQVHSKYHLLVGSNADGLWISLDGGATWTSVTFPGQSTNGTVNGFSFVNDKVGFMIHNPASGQGYVHYTCDGGASWLRLTTPANAGLNDVFAIDENTAYVVGNAHNGSGFVAKISG